MDDHLPERRCDLVSRMAQAGVSEQLVILNSTMHKGNQQCHTLVLGARPAAHRRGSELDRINQELGTVRSQKLRDPEAIARQQFCVFHTDSAKSVKTWGYYRRNRLSMFRILKRVISAVFKARFFEPIKKW
jgi:hypothetical protein